MLYLLAEWLQFEGLLNLVRYQTARAGGVLLTALLIGLVIGPRMIAMLWDRMYEAAWRFGGPGAPGMASIGFQAEIPRQEYPFARPRKRGSVRETSHCPKAVRIRRARPLSAAQQSHFHPR